MNIFKRVGLGLVLGTVATVWFVLIIFGLKRVGVTEVPIDQELIVKIAIASFVLMIFAALRRWK